MTGVQERIDHTVQARRLRERTVDEHNRGGHEEVLSVGVNT
jgi:hypothetical protein